MVELTSLLPPLHNRYYALRHGQSLANVQSVIVSHPTIGTDAFGLSEHGKEQVLAILEDLPADFDEGLKIVSSDFLRARETAAIIAAGLATTDPISLNEKLRERFFGQLDGQPDSRYGEVWLADALDPTHCSFDVESAESVVSRAVSLVLELESRYRRQVVLLVAHGDVLQLLQTAFRRVSPATHRELPALQVAEIRLLSA